MLSLFVVESPFQMINAAEARQHFSVPAEQAVLVIKHGVSEENRRLTRLLCDESQWRSVLDIGDPKSITGYLRCEWAISSWLRRLGEKPSRVFIGDYRSRYMRHLANRFSEDVVLLDDGAASLTVARKRCAGEPYARRYSGIKRWMNKSRLLGYRDGDIPSVTFFSAFSLELPDADVLARNTYAVLGARLGTYAREDIWYFVGSPLVELGIVSRDWYLHALEKISARYNGKVAYIPHRRESDDAVTRLCKALGWEWRRFDRPIELELIDSAHLPVGIAGFYSSALPSIATVLGGEVVVQSYHIPGQSISSLEYRGNIQAVYRHYASESEGGVLSVLTLDGAKYDCSTEDEG